MDEDISGSGRERQRGMGAVATRVDIDHALLWAGAGTLGTATLGVFVRSPDLSVDVTPWNDWRVPTVVTRTVADPEDIGPVLITIEYDVAGTE